MNRRSFSRVFTVLLALMILVSFSAYGNGAAEKQKPVKLQVFSMSANTSGLQTGWWADIIQEKVGVSLEFLPTGDQTEQKLQAYMASGELPDITVFWTRKEVEDAAKGRLLLCLDDYLDRLPNLKNLPPFALQYQRDYVSGGTGKVYAIPSGSVAFGDETGYGPFLRWDLYKKLGMPKLYSPEDYLPLLKKMQQLEPENADGKKTYAFTLWQDWDSYALMLAGVWGSYYGCDSADNLGNMVPLAQVDMNTNEVKCMLDPDSLYISALRLYFNANQMGLVDPDSLTQKFDTAREKVKQGRVLFLHWSWQEGDFRTPERTSADPPVGFRPVLFEGYKGFWFSESTIGGTWELGISSATKNKDACLRYLDFLCSFEGVTLLESGPRGVLWDVKDKGEPYVTDAGWDIIYNDKDLPGGGKWWAGTATLNWTPLTASDINPATGFSVSYKYWPTSIGHNADKLLQDWTAVTGFKTTTEMLRSRKTYTLTPQAYNLIPNAPDDMLALASSIGDIVKTNSWLMIFAKSEGEFNKLYSEMVTKAEGLGLQKLMDYDRQAWKAAKDLEKKYTVQK